MAKKSSTADKLYLEACAQLGWPVLALENMAMYPEEEREAHLSLYRMTAVIKARKNGHKLNFDDFNERKWFPWADMRSAGSGFSLHVVDYDDTHSYVGARLSSRTNNDAREIFEIMKEDYKNWMTEK